MGLHLLHTPPVPYQEDLSVQKARRASAEDPGREEGAEAEVRKTSRLS